MSSLWNVDDQTARLDELTSHQVEVKEAPLRRDVRSLGRLLGEVLKEQGGDELYAAVEELRLLMIEHRESINETVGQRHDGAVTKRNQATAPQDRTRLERAEEIVGRLSVENAHQMTKAFAIYFELTNLAETNHRKRRRGQHKAQSKCWPNQVLSLGLSDVCAMQALKKSKRSSG